MSPHSEKIGIRLDAPRHGNVGMELVDVSRENRKPKQLASRYLDNEYTGFTAHQQTVEFY